MNPNKMLWEKGDFTRIAQCMRESGEALVGQLGITRGLKVLDLGCGDGTTALPEAKLGADVLGVDIAANLVAVGNKRAAEHGLANCRFQVGDASNLEGIESGSFDLVVSIFGAMFAPRPFDVAKEMVRVAGRPSGDGKLDSQRSNPRRADPQDQLVLFPAAAGGVCQPDDVGCRGRCHRAVRKRRNSAEEHFVPEGYVHVQLSGLAIRLAGRFQDLLRSNHECL